VARLEDAGHMLHHDRPGELAQLVEAFLDAPSVPRKA
jgi:pimeloyl-ACP methyl ester carboxylesterase